MKPNITGPGTGMPGRDAQPEAPLTSIAAEGLGWSYRDTVRNILGQAVSLGRLRRKSGEWLPHNFREGVRQVEDKTGEDNLSNGLFL